MRGLVFSFLFLLLLPVALAGPELPITLANGAEAKITVSSSFYRDLPTSGYAPIAININNDSTRPRSWNFQFASPPYGFGESMTFGVDLMVQSKSTRTFKILVPLSPLGGGSSFYMPLGVTVSGPWTNSQSIKQFQTGKRSGKTQSAFVAISDMLATPSWGQLEKEVEEGKKKDLAGTRFDPNNLPEDWRGLAGVAGLWLTNDELRQLSPGQRAALRDWVCRGASLFIYGATELDPQFRSAGFGRTSVMPDAALDIPQTATAIEALEAETTETQLSREYNANWKAPATLGSIKLNAPLLIGLMALFAVVVGPVNLFVFAGRARRHRLFWTTPFISIAATLLLLGLIIFQDGSAGSGSRIALIYVSPTEKKDVILQEQITRTGVLLSSSFALRDPGLIVPISSSMLRPSTKQHYESSGTGYGGDWFASRSVQAHWIESIAPTRAEIVLANATEMGDASVRPVIVSNINSVLEQVYFRDVNGQIWQASNVPTGQRITMESRGQIPDLLPAEAGPRLRMMWSRVIDQKGYFYATSSDGASPLGTLTSIRWKNDRSIYVGPLSNQVPRL